MKVALIGASGFVGKAALKELVERGHEVVAIVRDTAKVKAGAQVSVVSADVLNEQELSTALTGADAVISAYNAGWTNPNLYEEFLQGSKTIQQAVKLAGITRLIVVGGAGSLFLSPDKQVIDSADFPEAIKPGARAAKDYLEVLKTEDQLDWTYFSPAIEMHPGTSGVRKGSYRIGLESPVFDAAGRSILSVEDTAVALVDELENPKHIHQRFTAAY